jgi:phospholipase D1/2
LAPDPEPPPDAEELRRRRRGLLRLLMLCALLAAAAVAFRFTPLRELSKPEELLALLERVRSHPAAPLAFLGLFVLLVGAGAPTTPLVLAGGVAFGVWLGALLSHLGAVISAAIHFYAARHLAYDIVARLVGDRHRQIERMLHRHGFWALVRLRFVPVPYVLANVACALAGAKPAPFLLSTALSMAPVLLVWSYFADALFVAGTDRGTAVRNIVVASLLLLATSFLPTRLAAWRRARRYRALRAQRSRSRSAVG